MDHPCFLTLQTQIQHWSRVDHWFHYSWRTYLRLHIVHVSVRWTNQSSKDGNRLVHFSLPAQVVNAKCGQWKGCFQKGDTTK